MMTLSLKDDMVTLIGNLGTDFLVIERDIAKPRDVMVTLVRDSGSDFLVIEWSMFDLKVMIYRLNVFEISMGTNMRYMTHHHSIES